MLFRRAEARRKKAMMTAWRPITGTITRLDPDLTAERDIQELFAAERIIGRGAANAENPAQFDFELAVAGRKLRVATLDESYEIIKGRSLENLAGYLHDQLRKVEVSLNGTVLHGPMDIGAVDIDDDVCDHLSQESAAESAAEATLAGTTQEAADNFSEPEQTAIPAGRGFALAEMATSEIPVLATSQRQAIGAVKLGDIRLLVADHAPRTGSWLIPAPAYAMIFVQTSNDGSPLLVVRRMGREKRWDWSGELPPFTWLTLADAAVSATDFVRDELGAGGMARAAVADLVNATFADVRQALLVPAHEALPALVHALGLPPQLIAVVAGNASVESVPGVRVFQPQGAAETFTEALAWEVAGEGRVNSEVAGMYRSLYLERPWLTSIVAALQASAGGAVLMSGITRRSTGSRSPWKIVAGTLLVANAISRIATTQYMNSAVQRLTGDFSGSREHRQGE